MSQGKKQNLIIIISAPSGSGKTTIVNRLLEQTSGLRCLVSYTTRPRRQGETGEKDYIFISNEEFKKKIETGDFLEWEEVFGNLYGSSEEQLKEALGAK
ncbi:MAG: guanylate kinase, partial [Candidatus Omnitrophota bacterium]